MNNIHSLNNTILDLPINRVEEDFTIKLKDIFSGYLDLIKKFDGNIGKKLGSNLKIIENEIALIFESIVLYYEGKTSKGYEKISECLNLLNTNDLLEIGRTSGDFYRIRVAQNVNLKRRDLFHIPFQMRERVATQRYSIPGLPCLYLADSIYTAWEEMGRPEFNSIHVSRYNFDFRNFSLLYLNITTHEIRKTCISGSKIIYENKLVKFLSYWPLLAACSFGVSKRNEVFKPEYIIPQMVLQWIIENPDIEGIQFKSNRIKSSNFNIGSFNNVAIPVQTSKKCGYCDTLKNNIKLSSPLSWSLLDISEPNHSFLKKTHEDLSIEKIRTASYIELIEGEKANYFNSKFGILESKLKVMELDFIS